MSDWENDEAEAFEDGFATQPDAFGRTRPPSSNPLITREQDNVSQSPPVVAAGSNIARPRARVALVGLVGPDGAMQVARHAVDGHGNLKALEAPRAPRADEYNSIMFKGKLVQGGVVAQNVPTGTNAVQTMQSTPLGGAETTKRWLLWGGIAVAAAGFGYAGYKWWDARRDGGDDFDDEG
jgi:hypothetical protein